MSSTGKSYIGQSPTDAPITANDLATGIVSDTKLTATILTALEKGQCRLTKSGSNLLLSRQDGAALFINGAYQVVPASGPTLAPPAVASTTYYIYAYMSGATMTLENSTTVPVADTTYGHQIKTGDSTRTLVGMARTTSGNAWADTSAQRFVISYFKRRNISGSAAFTANRSTASATYVELNTEIRNEFLTWADEAVHIRANGTHDCGNAVQGNTSLGIDGTTAEDTYTFTYIGGVANSGTAPFSVSLWKNGLSEGYHYATLLGLSALATPAWLGSGTAGTRTTLQVMVKG